MHDDLDTGAPVSKDGLESVGRELHESHRTGDHTIYLGKIDEGDVLEAKASPLVFYPGGLRTVELDE